MKNAPDADLIWTENSTSLVHTTPIFNVEKSVCTSPAGKQSDFILLQAPDWVTVLPVLKKDDKNYFLMVRQWRHGQKAVSTEFPGGVIDKGETPEEAARRELLEETGCKTENLVYLGWQNPNSAFMTNKTHFFAATDLNLTNQQNLDETEFLNASLIEAKEVFENMGHGEYRHALMSSALFMFVQKYGTELFCR